MPPPVVADHVPHRAPHGAMGGASPLLGDAMGEGHSQNASGLGDHDVWSSCNCRRRRCSQMPSGGRQGSSLPPPPPMIRSSSSSSSPPSPPGGIAGPALTCRIPPTLRVSPPCPCAWRVLSAPCATMLVGNDGRPSAPTSGPCQRPPPPRLAPFIDDAAVVAIVIRRRRVVLPPPPLPTSAGMRAWPSPAD